MRRILSIPGTVVSFIANVVAVLIGAVAIVVHLVGRLFANIFGRSGA